MSLTTRESIYNHVLNYYTKNTDFGVLLVYNTTSSHVVHPPTYAPLLEKIHEEPLKKFIGCGYPDVAALDGLTVLDMGCGYGRDCFLYSQMVGPQGKVIGVDMAPKSLDSAKSMIDFHMQAFGYKEPNVEFILGNIDDMTFIKDQSVDIVVSNGVLCVDPGHEDAVKEAYRALKPGGEFHNYDLYASAEQFDELRKDEVMWAEGFGGSFYWKRFVDHCCELGFSTPLLGHVARHTPKADGARERLKSEELYQKFAKIEYAVMSYRTFKVDTSGSSPATVTYTGGIPYYKEEYTMDLNTTFKKGQPVTVGPELAAILKQSRLAPFFTMESAKGEVQTKDLIMDPFKIQ